MGKVGRVPAVFRWLGFVVVFSQPVTAAEWLVDLDLQSFWLSNVFLDASKQSDALLRPSLNLGSDFARYWSAGYRAELNIYAQHADLLSHWHDLYLFLNPAWGEYAENEAVVELALETVQNQEVYQDIDLLQPRLLLGLQLEPIYWLRFELQSKTLVRLFYHDQAKNSVDTWVRAKVQLTLPSRTTLAPQLTYGYRRYLNDPSAPDLNDKQDQQLRVGVHLSQALWKNAGLQLDYAYLHVFDDCGILLQDYQNQAEFSFLGQDYFFKGHQLSMSFKQIVGAWLIFSQVQFEERDYAGWGLIDDKGVPLPGQIRQDTRLAAQFELLYRWRPGKNSSSSSSWSLGLRYAYLRQCSNHYWYDTWAHTLNAAVRTMW